MKGKNLIILTAVAAVLAAIAFLMPGDKKLKPETKQGELVFDNLPLNDIVSVTITSSNEVARMVKSDGTWKVETLYNYPVKFERLKEALLDLSKLKVGQKITASEKQMKEMKLVSPVDDKVNGGVLVEMADSSGKNIATLLIGLVRTVNPSGPQAYGPYPEGQFISRDEGKTAHLVSTVMNDFYIRSFDWIEDKIMNLPAADITEVVMTTAEGKAIKLVKPKDKEDLVIENIGENEELDTSNISSVESVLSYFYAKGIADPALTDAQLGMEKPATFVAKTKKNETYTVKIGKVSETDKDLQYIRVSAEFTGTVPDAEGGEKTDQAEEIKKLNDQLSKWTYLVDTYKVENMTKDRSKLVKEKAKDEEKKEEE